MEFRRYSGEPCGADNFPNEVLEPAPGLGIPMNVALTTDKKTLLLMDSVDYYQTRSLSKAEALALALKFQEIAEEMEE